MNNPKIGDQGSVPVIEASPPVSGLLQQDYTYQEDVDSGHPLNLDYFIPINCQRVVTARLSFRLRLYRTYSTFSLTTTSTDATGESGHHHTHTHGGHIHTQHIISFAGPASMGLANIGTAIGDSTLAGGNVDVANINSTTPASDSTGSSGHSHSHSHTVNVNSTLGVFEDVNNHPSYTVKFDGIDQTANLIPAGPFTGDQVEIDVSKFISTVVDRQWHTIALGPSARGRLQAILRVLYNSNQV